MCVSLIQHEQIETTLVKAKVLRRFIEPLITIAKNGAGDLCSRRKLCSILPEYKAVEKLINVLAPRYSKRPGGYTRVLKNGFKQGDGAPVAYIELIERNRAAKGQNIVKEIIQKDQNKKEVKA